MRHIRKFLRHIRLRYVALVFFGIIALFVVVVVVNLTLPDQAGSLYGSRLDGIENYPIDSNKIDAIKAEILENTNVKTIEYILKGKTINFLVNLDKDILLDTSKTFTNVILNNLSEEQKTFYDIQIFITSQEDTDLYPVIGYKHRTSEEFLWNNKNVKSN